MVLDTFAQQAGIILSSIFGPESILATFVMNNPIISAIILIVLLIIIIGAPLLFMDMIVDIWKVPFAVIVDLGVFFAFTTPVLVIPSIIASFLVFIFLVAGKNKPLAWTLGLISAALSSTLLFFEPTFILVPIIAFLPINTALMLIGTVLD